jgi:2-aminoadipate transaminase
MKSKVKTTALSKLAQRTGPPPISWLMHLALARPKLISLAAGFTDNESLPVEETRETLAEILRTRKTGQPALQYGSTQGDPVLRQLTANHFQRLDGAAGSSRVYSPERMIITSGSQQLLYMTTEALCDPGDIVIVEDPTYFVYLGILQSRGATVRGVRMENDGLDLSHLEKILESLKRSGGLRRVKALYLVSYFQNPTGITTSFEKKIAALKLLKKYERAAGHPIYLLEDAAYRELRFGRCNGKELETDAKSESTPSPRPSGERVGVRGSEVEKGGLLIPDPSSIEGEEGENLALGSRCSGCAVPSALAAEDFSNRVIYAGTFSKPFATGTRVGFGFLPEPVFAAVLRIKGNHDFGTSNLLQQLLARALATGRYQKHLAELQKRYARKAQTMLGALEEHFPAEVQWQEPEGGLYFWARLPRGLKSGMKSKLFQAALAQDVLYVPGLLCYAEDSTRRKPDNEMRISFGSASEENIREGIERLGRVLRKILSAKKTV